MAGGRAGTLGAALTLALVGSCGASSQASLSVTELVPPAEAPALLDVPSAFFVPGEQMTFELSLGGVLGGEAFTAVGEPGFVDGRSQIVVRSRVESAGVVAVVKEVRDDVSTWIAIDTGRPVKHVADTKFGVKESVIETTFNSGRGGDFNLEVQRPGRPTVRVRQQLPDDAAGFDAHAVLGALRAWQAADGDHASFYVIAGRRLWRNSVRFAGRETIRTALGRFPTVRIDGVAHRVSRSLRDDPRKKPRHYTIWLSDDGSRLPLLVMAKTEYGDIRVELTDYARPDRHITAR